MPNPTPHGIRCACIECSGERREAFAAKARKLAAELGLGNLNCHRPDHPACRRQSEGCADCDSAADPVKLAIISAHIERACREYADALQS